ncbi:MAG: hypothetical protein WCD69_04685 [Xanthobacteraceae bacterium]
MIRLLTALIRTDVRFPLFQLAFVVAIIVLLQVPDNNSTFGQIFNGLDKLVDASAGLFSELFNVKHQIRAHSSLCLPCLFTDPVPCACSRSQLWDLIGWSNAFGLRNAIAREAALRLIARGCHSRKSGRPTFLEKDGKRHLAASRMSAVGGNLGRVHYLR